MQVLVALAHSSASVVSHDELNQRCWGGLSVSEDSISRCIGQLRRLAQRWSPPVFQIVTTVGVGYKLDADPAAPLELEPKASGKFGRTRRRRGVLVAAAAVVGALIIGCGFLWWQRMASPSANVVALTAFEPLGGGQKTRTLGRAIDTELLEALNATQISARATSRPEPYSALVRQRIGLALDGTVEDNGREVHATIRLVDVAASAVVWTGVFDRPSDDAKTLPTEVAGEVADMVAVATFAKTASPPLKGEGALTTLLAAHSALRWNRSHDWARRIQLAHDVVRIDPGFAFGHSMLAWADTNAVRLNAFPDRSDEMAAEARREALKAIELDPDDAGAYFALALQQRRIVARESVLAQGLSRASHPATLRAALNAVQTNSLLSVGRIGLALPYADRALALDPLAPSQIRDAANAYLLAGHKGYAEDLIARGLARWPDHPDILGAQLYMLTFFDTPDAARRVLEAPTNAAIVGKAGAEAWRSYLAAKASPDAAHRKQAVQDVVRLASQSQINPRIAILMLAQLGDLDDAFMVVSELRNDISDVSGFQYSAAAAPLRSDPRFLTFARDSGLFDYWRETGQMPDICQGAAAETWCEAIGRERCPETSLGQTKG